MKKRIISFLLVILLLPSVFCFAELPLYTERTLDIDNPEQLEHDFWDYINSKSPNEYVTAVLMGIIYRESQFRSNAVAGWYMNIHYDLSGEFTKQVDEGLWDSSSLEHFIQDARYVYGGYGLIQWCMPKTLTKLYLWMKDRDTTIADIKEQINFTFWDLQENHWKTWDAIVNAPDLYTVNWWLTTYYEGTASGEVTYYYTMKYYHRYAKNGNS